MKLNYTTQGDYLLPDLVLPTQANFSLGKYGRLRKEYLKTHKNGIYAGLLISGKLIDHLAEIDETATKQLELIIKQMAAREAVTEYLKATDQMAWVGAMNNIKARAEEIVLKEVVYG